MEEKELNRKDIPMGYPLCFNSEYTKKDCCMHYQARLLKQQDEIMKIIAIFGSTEGIRFDHYVTGWDFGF